MDTQKEVKRISRKDFLKSAGKSIAGVALISGVGGILTSCANQPATSSEPAEIKAPEWPYTYVKLDGDKVAQRAYDAYKTGLG